MLKVLYGEPELLLKLKITLKWYIRDSNWPKLIELENLSIQTYSCLLMQYRITLKRRLLSATNILVNFSLLRTEQ